MVNKETLFINEAAVDEILNEAKESSTNVSAILEKAHEAHGLTPAEVATLLETRDPQVWEQIFTTAIEIKKQIYGNRIVIFAPLYLSNYCVNHCTYCGYHSGSGISRRQLTQAEIAREIEALEDLGHKRLAVETGEDPEHSPLEYVLDSLATIYRVRHNLGNIRRVNVNIAATDVASYQKLKTAGIGTYILFQETYHQLSYEKYHPQGPKHNYAWHLTAFDRAMEAGIEDVGAGILLGLYDHKFELISLLLHAAHLEKCFGVGPHTVSIPRIRPSEDVNLANFPYLVSDDDFKKVVALIRLALPYTGIILSTRESAEFRHQVIKLGVSQISAGSCTGVGGYASAVSVGPTSTSENTSQFQVADHRQPDDVYAELCRDGYLPSFCTACYRQGRTGDRFMALAKSGEIGRICTPNAILTFQEYLLDYAAPATKILGETQLRESLAKIDDFDLRQDVELKLERIKQGERDLYY